MGKVGENPTVPRNDLSNIDLISHSDELLPPANEEVVISSVDPLRWWLGQLL